MNEIDMIDIGRIDLNLLLSMEALLEERNVSRAARRLSLGQPAMSHNLARLRRLLGDELLVRSAGGMVLTAKAVGLEVELRATMRKIRMLFEEQVPFEPSTAEMTFRLGVTDSAEAILVPAVSALLLEKAPGVTLKLIPTDGIDVADGLETGAFDLAIGTFAAGRSYHKQRVIYHEGYHTIFNASLVAIRETMTLDDYNRHPMLFVEGPEGEALLDALGQRGVWPRIALRTPHLLTVPSIVSQAPMIATVHTQVAERFAKHFDLSARPLPEEIGLASAKLILMWHAVTDKAPAHVFLRDLVAEALRGLREKWRTRQDSNL
ncbi:LysR family transcriptional regulator [Agrobacterium albertimagni AOL15]|uniref:LysR family transcriptional regulator n=2 Tax=Agrobacterium albertimagni TaxID=147266 RepID=K2Q8R1_9HYPH|nr:LysR family transcriptional regulator [Agrobacterium albertimagni AOL15]